MAKVFLDTNFYIDIVYRKPEVLKDFKNSKLYYSPLSTHILFYALKIKVPSEKIFKITKKFKSVDLSFELLEKALDGPTDDLEDNIQLHSGSEAECDYFLTSDEKLLKMKYFGKTKITNSLQPSEH